MTLLEMVQRIAEFTHSGPINSVLETRESERIAHIVQETYRTLLLRRELPLKYRVSKLLSNPGLNAIHPTSLKAEEDILEVSSFYYTVEEGAETKRISLQYLPPEEFLLNSFNNHTDDSNVVLCHTVQENIEYLIRKDKEPSYYTIFAGREIVLDSYDSAFEDCIQGIHTLISSSVLPDFIIEDSFEIVLDGAATHSLLLSARTAANLELNDEVNQLDALEAKKQFNLQNNRNLERRTSLWESRRKLGRK